MSDTSSFVLSDTIETVDSGSLCRIFLDHEGFASDQWEHYLPIYEAVFAKFIALKKPVRLLEIGVQNGGSLQVWSKFFPADSEIVGIDIDPACARLPIGANISIRIGDATDPGALDRMLGDADFDIIVDDGSHHSKHVIATFEACFYRLRPGGIYLIEDLHCSYHASHNGGFRRTGSSIEYLKGVVDALNTEHFEADAAAGLDSAELQRLHQFGSQIACITFYDSVAIVEKLVSEKHEPYRRIMTGREARIVDFAKNITLMPSAQLRSLVLPPSAAASFGPALLDAVASAREEVGQLRNALSRVEAQHQDELKAAAERTKQQAAEAQIRLAEETKQRTDAEQRAEMIGRRLGIEIRLRTQAEQHAADTGTRLAEEVRQRASTEQRAAQLETERDRSQRERDSILNSTFWRITGAPRRIMSILPLGLRQYARLGARVGYWICTPHRTGERIAYFRSRQQKGLALPALPAEPDNIATQEMVTADPLAPQPVKVPAYDELFRNRFSALEPLRTYLAPHHGPRVTIVTDSINSGSLYGGVATAIVLGALLARRLDAGLRLVTRTEPPIADNIGMILRTNGVPWAGNADCLFSPPGSGGCDVPMSAEDVFLTTSWWTTRATRRAVPPAQIVYMLGEDERMFYPMGDDRLVCAETLSDPAMFYAVNSTLLLRHLQSEGMAPGGIAFEPAFPQITYYIEQGKEHNTKRNFFFYARPNNPRNLYWRGISAIAAALEEGVLEPDQWDFHFVGKDASELVLPRGVRPRIVQNLPWSDYAALVRRIDLGLSLMYTPHTSYPPLDLAASGAVVVTNRFGPKDDLSRFSPNLLCVDPSVPGLVAGLRQAVALAADRETRAANAAKFGMPRDWAAALAPILDHVAARRSEG